MEIPQAFHVATAGFKEVDERHHGGNCLVRLPIGAGPFGDLVERWGDIREEPTSPKKAPER